MSLSAVEQTKKALGARLREVRVAAGLSQRDVGRLSGWHSSKVSKIEYGKQTPTENDIRTWCLHCRAGDQMADLLATLRVLDDMWVEWRRSLQGGIRHRQREQIELEDGTRLLRWYEAMAVPGILHTADYARGIMSQIIDFHGVPDDVEAGVAVRMERQHILYRGDHRLHVVLAEQCLRTIVVDEATMAGQLDRLLAVQGLARVSLGVVPNNAPFRVLAHSFIIFDETKVMVETISAELTITQPREIALYTKAFEDLHAQAVYGADARALISAAVRALQE